MDQNLKVGRTYKIRSSIIGTEEIFTGNIKVKHYIFQLLVQTFLFGGESILKICFNF